MAERSSVGTGRSTSFKLTRRGGLHSGSSIRCPWPAPRVWLHQDERPRPKTSIACISHAGCKDGKCRDIGLWGFLSLKGSSEPFGWSREKDLLPPAHRCMGGTSEARVVNSCRKAAFRNRVSDERNTRLKHALSG